MLLGASGIAGGEAFQTMVFSSAIFLFVFLPIFLVGLIITSRLGVYARNMNLVVFSFAFYAFGGGFYTFILIGSILFNWAYARFVLAANRSRWVLGFGVTVNLLPLLTFKYLAFILALSSKLFTPFFSTDPLVVKIFLPAGISFYTFQAISYLIDVYRGETGPERSLTTFAAYKLLFPQLVAGPIVRYVEVKAAMHAARMSLAGMNAGIFFFSVGLAKKMLIADPIGRHVDAIYALPAGHVTAFAAWFANIGYFLQIFFDFSGYSEMAIGLGLMIGLSFPENFRQPYRSHSITEFWRRWHMTLSRWFRDYLYIPLGGNRHGLARTLCNLWIVFLLCGLWHGAALTFVAWGAFHGFLLVLERGLKRLVPMHIPFMIGWAWTTLLVLLGWVLFRSRDFDQAQSMFAKMALIDRPAISPFGWRFYLTPYMATLFAVGLFFAWAPMERWGVREKVQGRWGPAGAALGVALLVLSVSALAADGFNPFIYFRF
jgi:alginate O-acetyltransferase complex protein AlgI